MATIQCKACGKHYSYEKEGCCPNCGAYNRRPKRERVNADGTVQHMSDAAYEKRNRAAGKVCFEEKECHEQKVCYEDQTRHGKRAEAGSQGQAFAARLGQAVARRQSRQKNDKGRLSIVGIVIAIIVVANLLFNVLGGLLDRGESHWENQHTEPENVVPVDSDDYYYDAGMGETLFLASGGTLTVLSWEIQDDEKTIDVTLDMDFPDDEHEYYATLLCTDQEGEEQYLTDLTAEQTDEGKLVLHFDAGEYSDLKPILLFVDEWMENDLVGNYSIGLE